MQINFIVIGAMKCATSTICGYLEEHPDVFMVPRCEPNFFSHDANFTKGLDWYATHFRDRTIERICGEGSNAYAAGMMYPRTVERMVKYNPNLKIIYMVRHPVDRIVSAWIQYRADSGDWVPETLDRAVTERPERFIDISLYWKNISRYLAAFSDAQIFVGFVEDLNRDSAAFFARLTDFLGIAPNPIVTPRHANPSVGKRIPTPLYSALRRTSFAGELSRLTPSPLKRFAKQHLLSRTVLERMNFSQPVRALVMDAVRADAETFLAHYDKPRDYWLFE